MFVMNLKIYTRLTHIFQKGIGLNFKHVLDRQPPSLGLGFFPSSLVVLKATV